DSFDFCYGCSLAGWIKFRDADCLLSCGGGAPASHPQRTPCRHGPKNSPPPQVFRTHRHCPSQPPHDELPISSVHRIVYMTPCKPKIPRILRMAGAGDIQKELSEDQETAWVPIIPTRLSPRGLLNAIPLTT